MTIAMMIETMAGKSGAIHGKVMVINIFYFKYSDYFNPLNAILMLKGH
jgi:hypothetical protein